MVAMIDKSRMLEAPPALLLLPAPKPGYAVLPAGELKAALDKLAKFYAKHSTLPILSHVKIDARPGRLTMSATNLEAALTVRLDAKGRSYFSLCVPLASFRDMLARVDSLLSMTVEGYTLVLRKQSSGGIIRLKGMDSEEFPSIPANQTQHYFSIDSASLAREIERVGRAAATDEARPIFTAICAQVADDSLTLVAADSYRLHVSRIALDRQGQAGDTLIPAKFLQTLASILPKKSIPLHVWTNADALGQFSQIAIKWNGHTVVSRLIDGRFPVFERIMPDSMPEHYAVVDAKQMLDTVSLVGKVVADQTNNIVSIGWQGGKVSRVVVFAEAEEMGSQEEYIKADLDQGETSRERFIMANYKYLVDALKSISGYAVLRFWSPQKPLTVRALETEDTFTAVVMPMHTVR